MGKDGNILIYIGNYRYVLIYISMYDYIWACMGVYGYVYIYTWICRSVTV